MGFQRLGKSILVGSGAVTIETQINDSMAKRSKQPTKPSDQSGNQPINQSEKRAINQPTKTMFEQSIDQSGGNTDAEHTAMEGECECGGLMTMINYKCKRKPLHTPLPRVQGHVGRSLVLGALLRHPRILWQPRCCEGPLHRRLSQPRHLLVVGRRVRRRRRNGRLVRVGRRRRRRGRWCRPRCHGCWCYGRR